MSIAPFSSNFQPLPPAASPAASLLAPTPDAQRKADGEQQIYSPGARGREAADAAARSDEAARETRNGPLRQREDMERAERARSSFARVLEEKLRRFEEREGETRRREKAGKGGHGEEPAASARPEKELLELLRRAWSAAKAAEAQAEGDERARALGTAARRRATGGKAARDGEAGEAGPGEGNRNGSPGSRAGEVAAGLAAAAQGGSGKALAPQRDGASSDKQEASGRLRPSRGAGGREPRDPAATTRAESGTSQNGRTPRVVVLDLRLRGQEGGAGGTAADGKGGSKKGASIRVAPQKSGRGGDPSSGAASGKGGPGRPGPEEAQRSPAGTDRDFAALLKAHADRSLPADGQQAADTQRSAPTLKTFQERLIPEVLRHTGIILKEGGSGEIRLLLKPEGLGSVRIRLALSETSLEGRIVVENSTVKELMDGSLEHLRQALREGGFQSASLEVAVDSRQGNHQEQGALPVTRAAGAGSRELEQAVPSLVELISAEPSLVNLFV